MNICVAVGVWIIACLLILSQTVEAKLKEGECDVCIKSIEQIEKILEDKDRKDTGAIETKIRKWCKKARNKEERFCYYIGGTVDSATGILNKISKPLTNYFPPEKICEKLKTVDMQICELKYDKPLDWKNINLNKMRVKELKKILADWGEGCKACTEKSDFVKRIEELKPRYVKEEL